MSKEVLLRSQNVFLENKKRMPIQICLNLNAGAFNIGSCMSSYGDSQIGHPFAYKLGQN